MGLDRNIAEPPLGSTEMQRAAIIDQSLRP
jgi:hypothetical protein